MSEPRRSEARWRRWPSRVGLALGLLTLPLVCLAQGEGADPRSLRPAIDARFPGLRWVRSARLAAWMAGRPSPPLHLLDAREASEHAVSHISGARRVDPDRPAIASLGIPRGERVVVYCSVGYRSGAVAQRLAHAGYPEAYNLEGGIFAWANEGRPIYRGVRRARRVHPYDALWARMLRPELRAPLP